MAQQTEQWLPGRAEAVYTGAAVGLQLTGKAPATPTKAPVGVKLCLTPYKPGPAVQVAGLTSAAAALSSLHGSKASGKAGQIAAVGAGASVAGTAGGGSGQAASLLTPVRQHSSIGFTEQDIRDAATPENLLDGYRGASASHSQSTQSGSGAVRAARRALVVSNSPAKRARTDTAGQHSAPLDWLIHDVSDDEDEDEDEDDDEYEDQDEDQDDAEEGQAAPPADVDIDDSEDEDEDDYAEEYAEAYGEYPATSSSTSVATGGLGLSGPALPGPPYVVVAFVGRPIAGASRAAAGTGLQQFPGIVDIRSGSAADALVDSFGRSSSAGRGRVTEAAQHGGSVAAQALKALQAQLGDKVLVGQGEDCTVLHALALVDRRVPVSSMQAFLRNRLGLAPYGQSSISSGAGSVGASASASSSSLSRTAAVRRDASASANITSQVLPSAAAPAVMLELVVDGQVLHAEGQGSHKASMGAAQPRDGSQVSDAVGTHPAVLLAAGLTSVDGPLTTPTAAGSSAAGQEGGAVDGDKGLAGPVAPGLVYVTVKHGPLASHRTKRTRPA